MSQDIRLYGSAEVWDQPLQLGQRNLLQAVLDVWPDGIRTALDVGCGDGKVSSRLAQAGGLHLVGLDSSEEALSRLPFSGVKGNAQALPFADGAFDLTMSTDALEHMPDAEESCAWKELFRVASKVVMVAVPFREELLDATARCKACGHRYHVNWHERSYDIGDLHRHAPDGWRVRATILSGEPWSAMLPPETHLRREALNEWAGWEAAMCSHCGSAGSKAPEMAPLPSLLARALGRKIYPALAARRYCRSHSEILVIFEREGASIKLPDLPKADVFVQSASLIDFSRQQPSANLQPYSQVAQYVAGADGRWRAQFPLYDSQPVLMVERKAGSVTPLYLLLEDEAGILFDGCLLEAGQLRGEVRLPRNPVPGYYGVLASFDVEAPFASIQLGGGPEVHWSTPDQQASSTYLDLQYGMSKLYVQVAQPVWFDLSCLEVVAGAIEPTPAQVFLGIQECFEHALATEGGVQVDDSCAQELNELRVQIQNLEAERAELIAQAHALQGLAVDVQNLKAEREALKLRAVEADRLAVDVQNLTAEREALQRVIAEGSAKVDQSVLDHQAAQVEQLTIDLQNICAERDALLLRAAQADRQAVALQNIEAERDALQIRANEAEGLAVVLQNLRADREAALMRCAAADAAEIQVQNLTAERDSLLGRAADAQRLEVEVQNLGAERDALLARAADADRLAVDVQNLNAEREGLLKRVTDAERLEVEVQNLSVERDLLLSRAAEADRLAVGMQNINAERDQLAALVREAQEQAVLLQNLIGERDALLMRAREADQLAVTVQNLVAERDELLNVAMQAQRHAVDLQNVSAENGILHLRVADAEQLAVRVQNLAAEREALVLRAAEADRSAVEIQNLVAEQSALMQRLQSALEQINELDVQRADLAEHIRQQDVTHSEEVKTLYSNSASLQEQIKHLTNRSQEAECSLETLQEALSQAEADKQQLQAALHACQLRLDQLGQHMENRIGTATRNALASLRGKR
ncbi:methyltransferase domain-containing protein [Pseudomonas sp. PCH44]|uniref:methyltransferase domain-containing protein n=1 Tax=Pseudomonas sp. PCH44 TaxID=2800904 RepID=UPI001BAE78F4|nr:methyltransferase domain-containing protein [Pseudomonas sp. PCH44]MBS3186401.1 methyltransferase domain-containing protein [Pseudomonas sp. PCH44]